MFIGRLNRSGYRKKLPILVVVIIAFILLEVFMVTIMRTNMSLFFSLGRVNIFLLIIGIIYSTSLTVRRLHDLNHSGYWSLLYLSCNFFAFFSFGFFMTGPLSLFLLGTLCIPISLGLFLYLLFKRGTVGKNRFGPSTK